MANGFRTGAKKLDSPSRQLPVAQMKAFVMALKKVQTRLTYLKSNKIIGQLLTQDFVYDFDLDLM